MADPQVSAASRAAGVVHVRTRHTERFTVVGNHLAQHRDLTLTAIGLAVHIQSLPEGARVDITPEPAPEPEPASEPHPTAVTLLAGLRRHDERLLLTARDVRRLAPAVTAWLDRGVSPDALRRALITGLPDVPRHPAALLGYRLTALLPPPLPPPEPEATALRPPPLQNCDGCDRAFRSPEPGLCRDCRTAATAPAA